MLCQWHAATQASLVPALLRVGLSLTLECLSSVSEWPLWLLPDHMCLGHRNLEKLAAALWCTQSPCRALFSSTRKIYKGCNVHLAHTNPRGMRETRESGYHPESLSSTGETTSFRSFQTCNEAKLAGVGRSGGWDVLFIWVQDCHFVTSCLTKPLSRVFMLWFQTNLQQNTPKSFISQSNLMISYRMKSINNPKVMYPLLIKCIIVLITGHAIEVRSPFSSGIYMG